jgi:hypothetical protein
VDVVRIELVVTVAVPQIAAHVTSPFVSGSYRRWRTR